MVYSASEEELVAAAKADGQVPPVIRQRVPGGAASWTPSADGCLALSGAYAWSVRALGDSHAGEWSQAALFEVAPAAASRELALVLERVLSRYLLDRGIGPGSTAGLAAALAEELDRQSTPPAAAPPRMVSFQGQLVPADELLGQAAGPGTRAPLFTDEPELILVEAGTTSTDYTMLQLENPANALDWAWTVSSFTGNLFLTSPATGADGISFEVTGPIDVTTTVNFLKTVGDATIGSNANQGELDIQDLTVAGLGTTLCIDGSGPTKVGRCTSSRRYKKEIDDLGLGLDAVMAPRPVRFRWATDDSSDLGFVAEEVTAVDPLLATYDLEGAESGVKCRRLTAVLARAIQQLKETVDVQSREIERLEAQVSELAER